MNIFNQAIWSSKKSLFTFRDQATMEIRSGGGCLSIFGLPFLLAGLFVMQIPLGIVPVNQSPGSMPAIFAFLFGLVFASVGAVLVFGRSGIIVDLGRGRVIQWYGLMVPMKRLEYMLSSIDRVEMNFSSGDSDSAATWPVILAGETLVKPISVLQPVNFTEARQLAEALSRFLGKPLVDSSTGEKITRDPSRLNESYRDRIRRLGENVSAMPPEPSAKRSQVEKTGEGLVIHIPAASGVMHYIPLIFPIIFAGIVAWFFLPDLLTSPMPDFVRLIFVGFIGIFFIALPVGSTLWKIAGLKKEEERITVTKAYIRLETNKMGKQITIEIPIDELEDFVAPSAQSAINSLEMPGVKRVPLGDTGTPRMPDGKPVPRFLLSLMKMAGSRGIIARSDKAVIEFASGLDEAEVNWLFALIRRMIVE